MKFNITNTAIDKDELVVYYKFENNEKFTNKYKKTAKVLDILDWGDKKGKWFDDNKQELELIQRDLELEIYRKKEEEYLKSQNIQ